MFNRVFSAFVAGYIFFSVWPFAARADNFKPIVDGNLTNPANWTQGTLPAPTETGWVSTDQTEALFLSQDLTLKETIFFTHYPVTLDLKGYSLQSKIDMDRMGADVVEKSLSFKNGSLTGALTVDAPTSFENVQFNGSLQSDLPAGSNIPLLLNHVTGIISNWSVIQTAPGTHEVSMRGQSNIDFGTFSSQRLRMTEQSDASFDSLRTSKLTVDQGSKITSSESYLESIEVSGEGTEVSLGKVTQYGNTPITLNVHDGAFLRSGEMDFPPDSMHAPFRTIVVDGVNSKVVLDPSSIGVVKMQSTNTDHALVRITDGAELEINGQLNVLTGNKFQVGRVEVIDASIKGSLILSYSDLHLENALVKGESLLMGGGTLDGFGTIDVPVVFLGSSSIDPTGLLTFTGSISGSSDWYFNIDSHSEFDRVRIEGGLLFSQNLFVSFMDGFKGKVGDIFDILMVDGNFDVGQSLMSHLQVSNLPAGYAYQAILGDHHLSIEITAVPENSGLITSLFGVASLMAILFMSKNRAT